MYLEAIKLIKEVVDIDFDVGYEDSTLTLDISIKVPIAEELENVYRNLTT